MRKLLGALGLALIAASLSTTAALACADKVRALGRGIRYQQTLAARPASILIYLGESAKSAVRDPQLQPALKQAGYKLYTVQDRPQLNEALKRGKYDLVMTDVGDAEGLEELVQGAPSRPAVLPVISEGGGNEDAAAAKKFQRILRVPGKTSHYLTTIDEVMQWKLKAGSGKGRI